MNPNLKAFLSMISHSEGTDKYGDQDGYNVIVGGTLFDDYSDHPRQLVQVRAGLKSTAAGRYQLLARYYDAYKKELHLTDFSPESQDLIAIRQIIESRALAFIEAGQFDEAVKRCAHIWASLPGAGYGQSENSMASLRTAYVDAGGRLA